MTDEFLERVTKISPRIAVASTDSLSFSFYLIFGLKQMAVLSIVWNGENFELLNSLKFALPIFKIF